MQRCRVSLVFSLPRLATWGRSFSLTARTARGPIVLLHRHGMYMCCLRFWVRLSIPSAIDCTAPLLCALDCLALPSFPSFLRAMSRSRSPARAASAIGARPAGVAASSVGRAQAIGARPSASGPIGGRPRVPLGQQQQQQQRQQEPDAVPSFPPPPPPPPPIATELLSDIIPLFGATVTVGTEATTVALVRKGLDDNGLEEWCRLVQADLDRFGPEGPSKWLAGNRLLHLDLSRNSRGDTGVAHLMLFLSRCNVRLQKLMLWSNQVGPGRGQSDCVVPVRAGLPVAAGDPPLRQPHRHGGHS